MMYGYGEDALTLWAMTKGLPEFLEQLNDTTLAEDAIVLFRPSFGRRSPNPNAIPSVFGEFDAIVCTSLATYLVEGKWNSSSELTETTLTVADRQKRRHRVLRWYYDNWRQSNSRSWSDFRDRKKKAFEAAFPGLTIPTAGTTLAKNLAFVLAIICRRAVPLVDVLLFSTVSETVRPTAVNPPEFRLVVMHVHSIGGDGFIYFGK
jgi:hypothetical protein